MSELKKLGYEELNRMSLEQLQDLVTTEKRRIQQNEKMRQQYITDVLVLQEINDLTDMRATSVSGTF